MTEPSLRFGIAGWSYDDWKGVVYPAGCKDTLRFCAGFVDCIEINSSFYRTPAARTCASWVQRTAELPFFFTAKLPRVFTHDQRLEAADVAEVREAFAPMVEAGALRMWLAQFSYQFTAEQQNRGHLARLVESVDDLAPVAVEVRHRSWADPEALAFLRELDVSAVHLDYPGWQSGFGLRRTEILGRDRTAYFRLHGRNHDAWFRKDAGRDEVYDWEYAPAEVQQLVRRIGDVASDARETIVIANNHFHGQAMKVALELLSAFRGQKVRVPDGLLAAFPGMHAIAKSAQRGLF